MELPKIGLNDIQNIARAETGIRWIASGERADDSMARRARLVRCKGIEEPQFRIFPIYDWHTNEVVSYLRSKRIPMPPRIGRAGESGTSGFELRAPCLRWLRDNYPDDYQKVLEVFPHAEAAIKREEFSGSKENKATAL
jgi:3'-phosphoadenosine 5'-phosphosulfate sulfotransferase (PAPS reductase)/FAD synthetase